MTNVTATPATKLQIDALIDFCLDNGIQEAAGLLQLASDTLSNVARANDKPVFCCCLEHAGDREDCPIHGGEFSDSDIIEHRGLYTMGMGA